MKEITRKDYFKLKSTYLNFKLVKRITGFLFAISLFCLILFGILVTIFEQNNTANFIIENRDNISLTIRDVFSLSLSLYLVSIIICFIFKKKLLPMKKKLEVTDEL